MTRKGWLILSLLVVMIHVTGSAFWSLKPFGIIVAALVLFFCVLMPGNTLRRLLKLDSDLSEFNLALAYGLGLCLVPWLVSMGTYLDAPYAALVLQAAIGLPSVIAMRKKTCSRWLLSGEWPWVLACSAAISLFVFSPAYRVDTNGNMIVPQRIDTDVVYNASLINAVQVEFPPENPFMAGQPLNYHVGYPDLLALMGFAGRYDAIDILMRFSPVWLWVLLFFTSMGACLGLGLTRREAITATFLVNLVGGWAALPAGILTDFSNMTPLYSLKLITASNFLSNATLVATPLALLAAVAIGKSLSGGKGNWPVAAGLLVFSLALYKSFFHLVIASSWALALVLCRIQGRKKTVLPWLVSSIASAPLWLWYMSKNTNGADLKLQWTAGYLHTLGHMPFAWCTWLSDLYQNGGFFVSAGSAIVGTILFLLVGFGIGLCGAPKLIRTFFGKEEIGWLPIGCVVIVGAVASMILYDQPHVHVSSEWFFVTSQFFLMVLAAPFWARIFQKSIIGILSLVLLFGGTFQAVEYMGMGRWRGEEAISSEQIQASLDLAGRIEPGDVAAVEPDQDCVIITLTGASAYLHPIFYDLLIRYMSPERGAKRNEQYERIFIEGVFPDDLPEGKGIWVGFSEPQDPRVFTEDRIEERFGGKGWTWARLKRAPAAF